MRLRRVVATRAAAADRCLVPAGPASDLRPSWLGVGDPSRTARAPPCYPAFVGMLLGRSGAIRARSAPHARERAGRAPGSCTRGAGRRVDGRRSARPHPSRRGRGRRGGSEQSSDIRLYTGTVKRGVLAIGVGLLGAFALLGFASGFAIASSPGTDAVTAGADPRILRPQPTRLRPSRPRRLLRRSRRRLRLRRLRRSRSRC